MPTKVWANFAQLVVESCLIMLLFFFWLRCCFSPIVYVLTSECELLGLCRLSDD